MWTDSSLNSQIEKNDRTSSSARLLAGICAVLVTALLLAGYAYMRKRHAARVAISVPPVEIASNVPKGPPKVHVLVDDPLLKAGDTLIGGTVKNISSEGLDGLLVELELRRRKDGTVEQRSVSVQPENLGPNEAGRYAVKLPAQEYGGVRLVGVRENDSPLLAHTSSQGQRRPFEKTESKTVVVGKPARKGEEFLNTPDNPGRVP
jgi:hypothetical protein